MKSLKLIFITCLLVITSLFTTYPSLASPVEKVEQLPVILDGKTLFTIENPLAGLSLEQRVNRINSRLQEFANDYQVSVDKLEIMESDSDGIPLTTITAEKFLLLIVSEKDATVAGKPRRELAEFYLEKIKEAVVTYRRERSLSYLLRGLAITALLTLLLWIIILILNQVFQQIYQRLKVWGETNIRPINIGNLELIKANYLDNIVTLITEISQKLIILGLLLGYLFIVLSLFPWTENIDLKLWQYLNQILTKAILELEAFLPNLLTIILIVILTYSLLRVCKPLFRQLGEGTLFVPGFYPEWAVPTYRIVYFLSIALAAAIIFPLLPGFQSPAFQGISVFLGILFSLGSTSIIANIISGTILIYTRSFQVGDRIKVGDIFGQVIETTMLVTRLLTPTNVVISIPNSQIISSSIENFNFSAKELEKPLILRTQVYLGYEVVWQKAYKALIEAALLTDGITKTPPPFVLQSELNEVYVTYILNAYIDHQYFIDKTPLDTEKTHSQLHENIRECCQKAGIRIFAPSYEADPIEYGPVANLE